MESSIYIDGQSRREREFLVDSAASMHTMNKTGLSPAELETVKVSPLPTTVITASIDTTEEASYVKDLDMLVTAQPLEDTSA